MLKKNHKLSRSDFTTVFETRKVHSSPHFTLRVSKMSSWDDFGVSVVVSKKVEKSAVYRNRAKRRTYYALKILSESFKIPFKGVFVMKKSVLGVDFYDLETEIEKLVNEATNASKS